MSASDEILLRVRTDDSREAKRARFRWFSRRARNRRFERRHVLDVKLRSSQRRQNRIRHVTAVLLVLASVFFGVFLVWRGGEEGLRRFVYENPAFAIHTLDVQTDGVIAIEQLRRWAGVKLDDNLFAIDLARIKRDLELVPSIESVAVERILPHTLRIFITEREPIAQVLPLQTNAAHSPILYHLDARGFVMYPLEGLQLAVPALTNAHLPSLAGVSVGELCFGRQIDSPQVRAALQLIQAFERSPMAGVVDLRQIDVSPPGVLLVSTGQGTEVTFGLSSFDTQLRRWRAIHEHGQKTNRHLAWVDLSVANNVPARWSEAAPSEVPQPVKILRFKKRHV
jgi:cell division septal protein FtsQ